MMTSYDVTESPPRFALTQFTAEEFEQFWPQFERMLDLLPHTWRRLTKSFIYHSVMNNSMQAWGIGPPPTATLIILTSVNVYPAMKVLKIAWAAGSFDDDMIPLLEAAFSNYARLNGCEEMEAVGRPGWDSKFKKWGCETGLRIWTRKIPDIHIN